MLTHPRLKYCYSAEFLDGETLVLTSERDNAVLSDKRCALVLAEIHRDGMSLNDLVTKLEGKLSTFEVYYTVDILEKRGYLTETAAELPPESCAYWNSQGIDVNSLLTVLKDKPVCIETVGPAVPDVFRETFGAAGIKTGESGVLKVVITDDYQRKELRRINEQALETKQPWMLFKPVGVELWLGPLFIPGETGCWECLKQRLQINHPLGTFFKIQKNTEEDLLKPIAFLPQTCQIAAGLAAVEIVKWLYFGKNERLEGKLVTVDTHSLSTRSHVLVKRPQCKACGEPGYKPSSAPIILKRKPVPCEIGMGGYRDVPPEDTAEKYLHHVSPITGIMPKLEPYYSIKGSPIYNYSSGRNIALRSKTLFWMNQHIRSGNGGKGKTWAQAKAGALCEAVERYSLAYHDDEPYIIGSLKELKGDGIHPNTCMNYSETQYRNRETLNGDCSKFYSLVPMPFDESLKMHWTPVYSLNKETFKYLPSCFCYAQYPAEDELNLFSYPDSNGSAAGNSLEEAILQGFLELVERDSVALWWYNMLRMPEVDLPGFNDPYFFRLIEYYKSINRSLYVLDLTADLGIPAFGAISHRLDGGRENIVFGFGAHVDARIAIERALVELNQILPIANVTDADRARGKYLTQDKNFVDWLNTAAMENRPYLVPRESTPKKRASDYPSLCTPNIYDSVMFCLNTAAEHGLETFVLDLTREDVGLPVVKVIVPGMRHFWSRLAPGRLYEVPVKMGLLKKPLNEEDLNPVGLFI